MNNKFFIEMELRNLFAKLRELLGNLDDFTTAMGDEAYFTSHKLFKDSYAIQDLKSIEEILSKDVYADDTCCSDRQNLYEIIEETKKNYLELNNYLK